MEPARRWNGKPPQALLSGVALRRAVRGMDAAPGAPTEGFTASLRSATPDNGDCPLVHAAFWSPPAPWNGSLRSARAFSHFDGLNRLP